MPESELKSVVVLDLGEESLLLLLTPMTLDAASMAAWEDAERGGC